VGINVWPWVLDLANAAEYVRHHSVEIRAQLEQRIIWQPLESKLTLADIARISHTKHSMTVAGNHLHSHNHTQTASTIASTHTHTHVHTTVKASQSPLQLSHATK